MGDGGYSLLPPGGTKLACQQDKEPEYWVEFELVSEDGVPVAWEPYRIKLPDRPAPVTGLLDGHGFVRIDGITQAGTCQLFVPNLDQGVCRYLESKGPRGCAGPVRGRLRSDGSSGGPGAHAVRVIAGQCCSSIAYTEGHDWQTIWNAPQNSALQSGGRDDPNCLIEGESVHIPSIQEFRYDGDTDQRHRILLKGSTKLVIRIAYSDTTPRHGVKCTLVADGNTLTQTTKGDGKVTFQIHPLTVDCKLTVPGDAVVPAQHFNLKCGTLEPHTTRRGMQQRFRNLGTYDVAVDGGVDEKTDTAVKYLQGQAGVARTGSAALNVLDPFRNKHGS